MSEEHDWLYAGVMSQWASCQKCGVIRRADGQNGPCRGVVKIALRETDQAELNGRGPAPVKKGNHDKTLDLALTAERMIELAAYLDDIGRSRLAGHARDALTALELMRPVVEAATKQTELCDLFNATEPVDELTFDDRYKAWQSSICDTEDAARKFRTELDGGAQA